MSDNNNTIKLKFRDTEFARDTAEIIREMLKAITVNNGELLHLPAQCESIAKGYSRLLNDYRHLAERYDDTISDAEHLPSVRQDDCFVFLEKVKAFQKLLSLVRITEADIHNSFYIQLFFLLATAVRERHDESRDYVLCRSGVFSMRAKIYETALQIDCYDGLHDDRYLWNYRKENGGYDLLPEACHQAVGMIRIPLTDYSVFRDDTEILDKLAELECEMKGNGKIELIWRSTKCYVCVLIESASTQLCRTAKDKFTSFIQEKGYKVLQE